MDQNLLKHEVHFRGFATRSSHFETHTPEGHATALRVQSSGFPSGSLLVCDLQEESDGS